MLTKWLALFESLGFSKTETKIYLACLEIGPSSVVEISQKAHVSRLTTYKAIKILTIHGLMSSHKKEKRIQFMVETPEHLISLAETKIKSAETAIQHAKSNMQDLVIMQKSDGPAIQIFEGVEALHAIQNDILKSQPACIDEIGNLDEIDKVYNRAQHIRPALKKFDEKQIPVRSLVIRKKKTEFPLRTQTYKRIVLDPDIFNFKGDIMLYGNKIAMSVFKGKQYAVILESVEIADTLRALFNIGFNSDQKK